jgi:hypothetical protein
MLSIGLWRWYINITITIVDIIHRPVFYLNYNVSETGFCLHLLVEDQYIGPTWVSTTRTRRQNPVSETLCFKCKTGRLVMSRIIIVVLICNRHKSIDLVSRNACTVIGSIVDCLGWKDVFIFSIASNPTVTLKYPPKEWAIDSLYSVLLGGGGGGV